MAKSAESLIKEILSTYGRISIEAWTGIDDKVMWQITCTEVHHHDGAVTGPLTCARKSLRLAAESVLKVGKKGKVCDGSLCRHTCPEYDDFDL